ncbi:hypothetical protein DL768_005812 [Monosporascus sp. mg162]|nr:hypothetical protein DL768_005812 [Monosporascus sp. mg162]
MHFATLIASLPALALSVRAAAIGARQNESETTVAEFVVYGARCDGFGISFPVSVPLSEANQCNPMPLEQSYGSIMLLSLHESNPKCSLTVFFEEGCAPGSGFEFVSHSSDICVNAPDRAGGWRSYMVECA